MKKLVLNISESTYEKLRFEALHERKSIHEIIQERLFVKPFHEEVLEAYDDFMIQQIEHIASQ